MLAKYVNDYMPPFLMVDVNSERGNGIVRQGDKWGLDRFLWPWFLPPCAWTGHVYAKDGG